LPNDPRGSSSHEIRVEQIADLSELHKGRKIIQPPHQAVKTFYDQAREVLKHPLLSFGDDDIKLVASSFGEVIDKCRYTCYACAIMPEHIHILIRKHRDRAEMMIENLQKASRQALVDGSRRAATHPVWGGPGWKVFLFTRPDIKRIVKYIEQNPA